MYARLTYLYSSNLKKLLVKVFPGGNYDERQDAGSYEMTAIRETFEESGLLLASPSASISNEVLDTARHAIHSGKSLFQDFLSENALTADVSSLLPFTQWITPLGPPRRFHTKFYVAFLPASPSSGFSSGTSQQRLPTPYGGQEVAAARFVHPVDALAECQAGKVVFMPPQYYILSTLANILIGHSPSATQRAQVEALSVGPFGTLVVNPRPYKGPEVPEGLSCLTYEGDEQRGGPPGRLHRSYIRFDKSTPREIRLLRNFDVFTDLSSTLSKI
ncbi:hypothetical protein PENSPDRAFT_655802 [Peniophora sp. CONT]|nr:hypothetical protein PENSPDRAFT_655802 [Peniophora sp. CONT]